MRARGAEPLRPLVSLPRAAQRTHLHPQQAGGDGHAADAVGGGLDVHSPVQVDQARQRDCEGDGPAQSPRRSLHRALTLGQVAPRAGSRS